MQPQLVLEILVAILLGVTIGYCFILNRKLATMRDQQGEMQNVVRLLNEAVDRAGVSVGLLHRQVHAASDELSGKIKSGRAVADELSLMVQSGNNIADRLASAAPDRARAGQAPQMRKPAPGLLKPALAPVAEKAPDVESEDAASPHYELRQALRTLR